MLSVLIKRRNLDTKRHTKRTYVDEADRDQNVSSSSQGRPDFYQNTRRSEVSLGQIVLRGPKSVDILNLGFCPTELQEREFRCSNRQAYGLDISSSHVLSSEYPEIPGLSHN